jgi:hypothetical protein
MSYNVTYTAGLYYYVQQRICESMCVNTHGMRFVIRKGLGCASCHNLKIFFN